MTYTITLADGRKIENLTMNGTNFVSQTKIDESIFKNNLSTVKINETTYHNLAFLQQMEWEDGTWYFILVEDTADSEESNEKVKELEAKVTELSDALTALLTGKEDEA